MTNNSNLWEPLPKESVEGQVFSMPLSQNDGYTFGRLKLMPHSKILLHLHDKNCEWYLDEDTGKSYFCAKGDSHEFVNDSDSTKCLLSIKKD